MVVNLITTDDLQAFKEGFLEYLVQILEQKRTIVGHKYLKTEDVCRLLKISPSTLYRYRADGTLPHPRIRNICYYDYTEIRKLIDKNENAPPERGGLLPGEERERRRKKSANT